MSFQVKRELVAQTVARYRAASPRQKRTILPPGGRIRYSS